jgi:hypothetical protein
MIFVQIFYKGDYLMREIVEGKNFKASMKSVLLFFALLTTMLCFLACTQEDLKKENLKTEYQGVLLLGGTGYFGKIEKIGPRFVEMTEVYYVQNQQNPETKEVQSLLVKRGKEWHGPDRMYINLAQVIMIEPVGSDSRLYKMIKDLKTKAETGDKK